MVRTQIQLEDHIHRQVRRLALEKHVSMAELIRQFVHQGLSRGKNSPELADLAFVGAGASGTGDLAENHDRYLNEED